MTHEPTFEDIAARFRKLQEERDILRKALRRVQGASDLKECHRIAESILNRRD